MFSNNQIQSTANVAFRESHWASFIGPKTITNTTLEDMQPAPDYKIMNSGLKQTKYIGVAKYEKRNHDNSWAENGVDFSDAVTNFRRECLGYTNGDIIGTVTVTYYVSYKKPIHV